MSKSSFSDCFLIFIMTVSIAGMPGCRSRKESSALREKKKESAETLKSVKMYSLAEELVQKLADKNYQVRAKAEKDLFVLVGSFESVWYYLDRRRETITQDVHATELLNKILGEKKPKTLWAEVAVEQSKKYFSNTKLPEKYAEYFEVFYSGLSDEDKKSFNQARLDIQKLYLERKSLYDYLNHQVPEKIEGVKVESSEKYIENFFSQERDRFIRLTAEIYREIKNTLSLMKKGYEQKFFETEEIKNPDFSTPLSKVRFGKTEVKLQQTLEPLSSLRVRLPDGHFMVITFDRWGVAYSHDTSLMHLMAYFYKDAKNEEEQEQAPRVMIPATEFSVSPDDRRFFPNGSPVKIIDRKKIDEQGICFLWSFKAGEIERKFCESNNGGRTVQSSQFYFLSRIISYSYPDERDTSSELYDAFFEYFAKKVKEDMQAVVDDFNAGKISEEEVDKISAEYYESFNSVFLQNIKTQIPEVKSGS